MSTIKCYDTLKCMYVEVEVTEEVYTYIKRSYWREDMAEEEVSLTKKAYYKVHKFAEELIDERRGLDDEAKKDCSTMFGSMRESFISML